MLWHRWNGTETIDTPNYTKRPYLYELPVLRQDISDYMHYETGDELAVSMILSDMGKFIRRLNETYETEIIDPYPEYHELLAKRLPWLIKHLCERTDMVERGVAIRPFITTDIREVATKYLEACSFPMDTVTWIESFDSQCRWMGKYDAIRHPALHFAKRVLHFDLSFLIGLHPAQRQTPIFAEVMNRWNDEDLAVSNNPMSFNRGEHDAVSMPRVEQEAMGYHPSMREHPIWTAISRCYGGSIASIIDYWTECDPFIHIGGGIVGFSRQFIQDNILQRKFNMLLIEANNDEAVFGIMAHYERDNLKLANIHDAFEWRGHPYEGYPYETARITTCEELMPTELFLRMHTQ